MPRMLAASRGARSRCMRMRIDDCKREDNTLLGGFRGREFNAETLRPQRREDKDNLRGHDLSCPYRLVAEGFAGFQGVGDAFLGFLFAAEGDEGFTLEVEDVLFADELRSGERAAGENVGEFAGDVGIVI